MSNSDPEIDVKAETEQTSDAIEISRRNSDGQRQIKTTRNHQQRKR